MRLLDEIIAEKGDEELKRWQREAYDEAFGEGRPVIFLHQDHRLASLLADVTERLDRREAVASFTDQRMSCITARAKASATFASSAWS